MALGTHVMPLITVGAAVYGSDSCILVLGYWYMALRPSASVYLHSYVHAAGRLHGPERGPMLSLAVLVANGQQGQWPAFGARSLRCATPAALRCVGGNRGSSGGRGRRAAAGGLAVWARCWPGCGGALVHPTQLCTVAPSCDTPSALRQRGLQLSVCRIAGFCSLAWTGLPRRCCWNERTFARYLLSSMWLTGIALNLCRPRVVASGTELVRCILHASSITVIACDGGCCGLGLGGCWVCCVAGGRVCRWC